MPKFKKILALTSAVLLLSSSVAFASPKSSGVASSTYDDLHRDTTATLNNNSGVVTPYFDGYLYSVSTQTQRKYEDWSLIHTNADDVADSVTYSVAITKSGSISLGGEAEYNGLIAKAKYNANVSVGVSTTQSVSITWNLPKGKWRLSAGAMFNKVVGYKEYWISGSLISKQAITADYTYDRYSDQVATN